MEKYYIEKYNTTNSNFGYNLSSGGGIGVTKFSEETLLKMRARSLGEKNSMYGKTHTKKTKEKITRALQNHKNTSKKVQCIETDKIFLSTREVERQLGFNHSGISAACSGRQKTCGGYHWRYYEETK